jgi:molybdopterin/thiamine biosynthesis adenylyltransferase
LLKDWLQTRLPSTTDRFAFGVFKLKRSGRHLIAPSGNTINAHRIRTANILLVSIKALANEIAKNLVLAGIGSITLADHEVVTEQDLGAQFFVSDVDVGKNVCQPEISSDYSN